eukprot:10909939-Heterocapsa_arctica.AAC.1
MKRDVSHSPAAPAERGDGEGLPIVDGRGPSHLLDESGGTFRSLLDGLVQAPAPLPWAKLDVEG